MPRSDLETARECATRGDFPAAHAWGAIAAADAAHRRAAAAEKFASAFVSFQSSFNSKSFR
jgi:hypothetical protein